MTYRQINPPGAAGTPSLSLGSPILPGPTLLRRLLALGLTLALGQAMVSGDSGEKKESSSVPQGSGSYTTQRPAKVEPLPERIYRIPGQSGPVPTNQWWSSLVWQRYSQNLFPHPLAMRCHAGGLTVTYPGAAIVSGPEGIMGGGLSEKGDFVIGHSAVEQFPDTNLAASSGWFVTAEFKSDEAGLRASFGHGSPFVFCRVAGGGPRLTFGETPVIWSGEEGDPVIGLTVRGNHYGIFGAAGSKWHGLGTAGFTHDTKKDYFSVALLPDNSPSTLEQFARRAHNHVVDTQVSYRIDKGRVESTYKFTTESMEGRGLETLFALYPHHWKYSGTKLAPMTYASVRGTMKLAAGTEFKTSVPIQGLLPFLPPEGLVDSTRVKGYLEKVTLDPAPPFADTYWEGKFLGKLTTLAGIAEAAGESAHEERFIAEIRRRLENWFTASKGEDAPLFYYDARWGTLIGNRPSYMSDSKLNDHHFHYGYFIRAAAEVARRDPEWAKKWGPMVNLLIRDIASPKRGDPMFPYLRCFDLYAGHSWASGDADFGDGNNQESSSESLNAWYGIILWGEVTGLDAIRDLGLFLFNTERTAAEEYWFDVSGTNFPEGFPESALGMIWGGKGAFATWFSAEPDHIYGINWLPFTPASVSLGRFPDYVRECHERIVEIRKGGDDFSEGWGDLVVMFGALGDPGPAAAYLEANPDCNIEGGNSHAFLHHWIHTLDRLGLNDASVTSDHPYFNVYLKDGKKTYAAYNFGAKPLKVRFSDGHSMDARPRSLTTSKR